MKILHVHEFYGRAGGGGSEQSVPNLCALLEERGHATAVVYGTEIGDPALSPARRLYHVPRLCSATLLPNRQKLNAMAQILHQEEPDVVHLHQVDDAHLAGMLARCKPTLLFLHNHVASCVSGTRFFRTHGKICGRQGGPACLYFAFARRCNSIRPASLFYTFLRYYSVRRIVQLADVIAVDTEYMRETLLATGVPRERVHVTPTITELPPVGQADGFASDNTVLYVGRAMPEKGLEVLLEALAGVSEPWSLTVVGGGYGTGNARALAERLGVAERARFEGWIRKDRLAAYYRSAAVVVVPSAWPEPLGLVGPEAMAYGRPVVAFDVGGISDWLVDGETGYLVPAGDVTGLGARIASLLRDKPLARQLGRNGRHRIERVLSPAAHVATMLRLYELAIGLRRAGREANRWRPGEGWQASPKPG